MQMIHLDHFSVPVGGPSIDLDPGFIRGRLAQREVEVALEEAEILFREVDHVLDTHRELETKAGVRVLIVNEEDWKGLYAVYLQGSSGEGNRI